MAVLWMAIVTLSLRVSIWASNEITLRYLYGAATVERLHLRIVRIKPELVVSNGDVLKGIGPYHYFVGVAIWLPLSVGLVLLTYYTLFPTPYRRLLESKQGDQTASAGAVLWMLTLFVLVAVWLPMRAAIAVAVFSLICALVWVRKIQQSAANLE